MYVHASAYLSKQCQTAWLRAGVLTRARPNGCLHGPSDPDIIAILDGELRSNRLLQRTSQHPNQSASKHPFDRGPAARVSRHRTAVQLRYRNAEGSPQAAASHARASQAQNQVQRAHIAGESTHALRPPKRWSRRRRAACNIQDVQPWHNKSGPDRLHGSAHCCCDALCGCQHPPSQCLYAPRSLQHMNSVACCSCCKPGCQDVCWHTQTTVGKQDTPTGAPVRTPLAAQCCSCAPQASTCNGTGFPATGLCSADKHCSWHCNGSPCNTHTQPDGAALGALPAVQARTLSAQRVQTQQSVPHSVAMPVIQHSEQPEVSEHTHVAGRRVQPCSSATQTAQHHRDAATQAKCSTHREDPTAARKKQRASRTRGPQVAVEFASTCSGAVGAASAASPARKQQATQTERATDGTQHASTKHGARVADTILCEAAMPLFLPNSAGCQTLRPRSRVLHSLPTLSSPSGSTTGSHQVESLKQRSSPSDAASVTSCSNGSSWCYESSKTERSSTGGDAASVHSPRGSSPECSVQAESCSSLHMLERELQHLELEQQLLDDTDRRAHCTCCRMCSCGKTMVSFTFRL